MAFEKLNTKEQKIVLQVMKLILTQERYIEDWEFQTRMGITRDELRQVIAEWPCLKDDDDRDSRNNPNSVRILAINNSLNEVLHGVGVSDADWAKWIVVLREEVQRVYRVWAFHKGWKSTGLMSSRGMFSVCHAAMAF